MNHVHAHTRQHMWVITPVTCCLLIIESALKVWIILTLETFTLFCFLGSTSSTVVGIKSTSVSVSISFTSFPRPQASPWGPAGPPSTAACARTLWTMSKRSSRSSLAATYIVHWRSDWEEGWNLTESKEGATLVFRGPVEGKHQAPGTKHQAPSTRQHTCCALTRTLSWTSNNRPHIWLHTAHRAHTCVCVTNQLCEPALGSNQPASAEGELPQEWWDIWDIWDIGTLGHLGHWDIGTFGTFGTLGQANVKQGNGGFGISLAHYARWQALVFKLAL